MSLSHRQERAVEALLSQPSMDAAASVCGVTTRTLRRWLRDPQFAGHYHKARSGQLEGILDCLRESAIDAVQVLVDVASNVKSTPASRVSAAARILEFHFKSHELVTIEKAPSAAGGNRKGETVKFRDRIRRIEEKLSPATRADGKKLIPPLLLRVLVSAVVDPATGNCRPSTLEESEHAQVHGKVIDRERGESFEHFERRVKALLPPPQYPFAQEITFWGACGENPADAPAASC